MLLSTQAKLRRADAKCAQLTRQVRVRVRDVTPALWDRVLSHRCRVRWLCCDCDWCCDRAVTVL